MDSFNQQHLANIKTVFSRKSGVQLQPRSHASLPRLLRPAVLLAACFCCLLAAPTVANTLFSPIHGDDLVLGSSYLGAGQISVQIENRADKQLVLQPQLRLMQWNSGQEVPGDADAVTFSETVVPAGESRTITINLSAAYNMEQLEQPLSDDHYYLVLTNNSFIFGHDWLCSVDFAAPLQESVPDDNSIPQEPLPGGIEESLRFYFTAELQDATIRQELQQQYATACEELFAASPAPIVRSYSPIVAVNRIDTSLPYLVVAQPTENIVFDSSFTADQQQLIGLHWQTATSAKHLLAGEGEYALVLSGSIADEKYPEAWQDVPLFYLFTYEKAAIENDSDLAFIYGQLLSFKELAQYRIFEDEQFVMYEVSPLIYSDLAEHAAAELGRQPNHEELQVLQNIYDHYRTELPQLIEYKQN